VTRLSQHIAPETQVRDGLVCLVPIVGCLLLAATAARQYTFQLVDEYDK
jgi:hypothetical protein